MMSPHPWSQDLLGNAYCSEMNMARHGPSCHPSVCRSGYPHGDEPEQNGTHFGRGAFRAL